MLLARRGPRCVRAEGIVTEAVTCRGKRGSLGAMAGAMARRMVMDESTKSFRPRAGFRGDPPKLRRGFLKMSKKLPDAPSAIEFAEMLKAPG